MTSDLIRTIAHARSLEPVGSPCTDVCKLDPESGLCQGCYRTRDEIRAWKTMSDVQKLSTFDVLLARHETAAPGTPRDDSAL
jgi:uncharacterized protein